MIKTARVFLFEDTKQRLNNVDEFGTVEYIFPPSAARGSIWETDVLSKDLIDALNAVNYSPKEDYIAVTGHLIPVAVMISAIANEYGSFAPCYLTRATIVISKGC